MLLTLARFYSTLSLALPPVALVVLGAIIVGFKELLGLAVVLYGMLRLL